jgi:uncharacterized protein (TIGR02145 family)
MNKIRNSFTLITALAILAVLAYSCKKTKLETGSVTDIDGNTYKTVKIGEQWWMAENLKTTHYSDGTPIERISASSAWVQAGADTAVVKQAAYCWYGNDSTTNAPIYGALYNWYTASHAKLAPAGWHVPTDEDINVLIRFIGNARESGGTLKDGGVDYWKTPNASATNETGFSALPGGYRDATPAAFHELTLSASFWTSSDSASVAGKNIKLVYTDYVLHRQNTARGMGFSIRCVKD